MDRNRVITGLNDIGGFIAGRIGIEQARNFLRTIDDAIDLMKEQEAEWIYGEDETGVDGWHCSYCGFFEPWFYEFTDDIDFIKFYSFCPGCGRRMTSYTGKPTQEGGEVDA